MNKTLKASVPVLALAIAASSTTFTRNASAAYFRHAMGVGCTPQNLYGAMAVAPDGQFQNVLSSRGGFSTAVICPLVDDDDGTNSLLYKAKITTIFVDAFDGNVENIAPSGHIEYAEIQAQACVLPYFGGGASCGNMFESGATFRGSVRASVDATTVSTAGLWDYAFVWVSLPRPIGLLSAIWGYAWGG